MNAIAPQVAEWTAMWATALPGFEVDSLWIGSRRAWKAAYVRNLEGNATQRHTESNIAFQILGIPSPDGRLILDVDWYQVIEPSGETLEVGGEPDSQPVLIDVQKRTEAIIAQCGTPCGYHWGRWLSPRSFALGGWQNADDLGHWKQGFLDVYSLRDSTVSTYVTRIISDEHYGPYLGAWKAWLLRRYQSSKASRPSS